MSTLDFLVTLFGNKPDGSQILIWSIPSKLSAWCDTPEEAANAASKLASKPEDVYVGVGLAPKKYRDNERCPNAEIQGIVGLWADIDIAGPTHKNKNLPPDIDSAILLALETGAEPSIIIHSGHGIQCWWLFNEPWIFDTPEERQEAAVLAARWIKTIKAIARNKKWEVDSTFDLARVLRVVGTYNCKQPEDKPLVYCLEFVDKTYNLDDFDKLIVEPEPGKTTPDYVGAVTWQSIASQINLSEDADVPFKKWEALCGAQPDFLKSYERKRSKRDMPDQSGSSYDMSLASFAVAANWTDQEIANLLIASRRKNKDDLKLRADYYARTISRARNTVRVEQAQAELEDAPAPQTAEEQSGLFKSLSKVMGVTITQFIKYKSDPPTYKIEMNGTLVPLGDVNGIMNQVRFRNAAFDATGKVIQKFKSSIWDGYAEQLYSARIEDTFGDEATEMGAAQMWINGYLDNHKPIENEEEAIKERSPYIKDGYIIIFGSDMRRWMGDSKIEKISLKQMGSALRAFGCLPDRLHGEISGRRTSFSVWKVPMGDG